MSFGFARFFLRCVLFCLFVCFVFFVLVFLPFF